MRITVMGAGAVGAYLGARLAGAGHEVAFVARGPHLAMMQRRGLEIHSTCGDVLLNPVRATASAADIGESDVVLFTVKAQDTQAALPAASPLLGPETRILTLQNGVGNVEALVEGFGRERVWGGVAYIEVVVAAPGVVVHKSPFARVAFGGSPSTDGRLEGFRRALEVAGISAEVSADVQAVIWRKWLFICAFSGMTALTRQPIGVVLHHPETSRLLRRAMEEIEGLARARGVALPADIVESTMAFATEGLEPTMTSSLAQDLAAGKRLELDALNGAASRLGREHDRATPVNDFITAALRPFQDGQPVSKRADSPDPPRTGDVGSVPTDVASGKVRTKSALGTEPRRKPPAKAPVGRRQEPSQGPTR